MDSEKARKGTQFVPCMHAFGLTDLKDEWKLGDNENKPICVLTIGMAGSGKSSLMQVRFTMFLCKTTEDKCTRQRNKTTFILG